MFIQTEPDIFYESHRLLIEVAILLLAMFPIVRLVLEELRAFRRTRSVSLMQNADHVRFGDIPACVVSYVDLDGVRHSVEVQADGLYEAAVLAIAEFRKHDLTPAGLTELQVEVRSSITHAVTVQKVQQWLARGVKSPREAVLKERLRVLL